MKYEITFNYLTKKAFYFSLYFPNIIFFIACITFMFIGVNGNMDQNMLIILTATIVFSIAIGPILRLIFVSKCRICFEENTFTIICNEKKTEIPYQDVTKLKYYTINRMFQRQIQTWSVDHCINICSRTSQYFFASTLIDLSNSYKKNERPVIYLICLELSRRSGCHLLCTSTDGEEFQPKDLKD